MSALNDDGLGPFLTNAFGDRYLHAVNGLAFSIVGVAAVHSKAYGDCFKKKDSLFVIVGTDSGLLLNYAMGEDIPSGSRYLFVEIPQVYHRLNSEGLLRNLPEQVQVVCYEKWWESLLDFQFENYCYIGNVFLHDSIAAIDAHISEYPVISSQIKEELNRETWKIGISLSSSYFTSAQIDNLAENRIPGGFLRDLFKGKTALVLGGGPSLDALIPWIKTHRKSLAVLAVSRISKRLQDCGLIPDMVFSIDPQHVSFEVSKEMLQFAGKTIFVHSFHASPALVGQWSGPSIYLGPRLPWTLLTSDELDYSGPTVTNTALSTAVAMGFSKILLAGVDLCFSREGFTHAEGSNESKAGPLLDKILRKVETNDGGLAETSPEYAAAIDIFAAEAKNAKSKGCEIVNLASVAAKIEGVEFVSPTDIIYEPLLLPAYDFIASHMPEDSSDGRISHCNSMLIELGKSKVKIEKIHALASEALKCNDGLFGRNGMKPDFKYKIKMDKIEKKLNKSFSQFSVLVKTFGANVFLGTGLPVEASKWSDEEIETMGKLYYQSYIVSADKVVCLVDRAIERLKCRIDEDSQTPDFTTILNQWRQDCHPGRVNLFRFRGGRFPVQYADQIKELEAEFHEMLNKDISALWEAARSLNGLSGKTLKLFRIKDREALCRLKDGIGNHRDQGKAAHFKQLIRGYILELDGNTEGALYEYQQMIGETVEPATEDALKRIATISLQAQDVESALISLECLTGISPVYELQYADMLKISGDIDGALDMYCNYVERFPADIEALIKLVKIYQGLNNLEAVKMVLDFIFEQDPENAVARDILAKVEASC